MTKSNLEKKGLFLLTLPGNHPSLREITAETSRQELKQKPQRNTGYWLAPQTQSTISLIQPRYICLGLALPTVGWAPPYQPAIKNKPHRPVWVRRCLNWGSPFPGRHRNKSNALKELTGAEAGRSLWVRGQPGLQELVPGQAPKLQKNPVSKTTTTTTTKRTHWIGWRYGSAI